MSRRMRSHVLSATCSFGLARRPDIRCPEAQLKQLASALSGGLSFGHLPILFAPKPRSEIEPLRHELRRAAQLARNRLGLFVQHLHQLFEVDPLACDRMTPLPVPGDSNEKATGAAVIGRH